MTSFPYLKVARDFGVPYGDVVRHVQRLDERWLVGITLLFDPQTGDFKGCAPVAAWIPAAEEAWRQENKRRRQGNE